MFKTEHMEIRKRKFAFQAQIFMEKITPYKCIILQQSKIIQIYEMKN